MTKKLPEDVNQIATFLMRSATNIKLYYWDIKNNPTINPKLKKQLIRMIYMD